MDPTNFASDKIYNISGGAGDVAFGMVRMFGGVTGESVAFVNVYLAYDTSVAGAFGGAMLYGRRIVGERGDFGTYDDVSEIARASV